MNSKKHILSRENNFDLIRFIAAFQVIAGHSFSHLHLESDNFLLQANGYFPGVLVFFTISGFLIYASLERNGNLKKYFINRFLRIYPGLWVCLSVTIILLICFGVVTGKNIVSLPFISWLAGQLTIGQYYTPEMLRSWGVGTPNGSLWTIPVEIEFYILLPILVLAFSRIKLSWKFLAVALLSMILSYLVRNDNQTNLEKLIYYSCLPYLYCFLTGSLLYIYWSKVKKYLEHKFLIWLGIFLLFCVVAGVRPSYHPINITGFIVNVLLSLVTISGAYSCVRLNKILRGYDISYGMYIYHMPVINSLVQLGYEGKAVYFWITFAVTLVLSMLSWVFIERKCLALKNRF